MVWKQTNYGGMNDKEKQQLINEVNILRELKHENIVRCFDKFVDKKNTSIYLVMECCKGGDLGQLINKCRQPKGGGTDYIQEDFVWRIFTQVVLALYECHRRKNKQIILHRDLKPSNIFLDEYQNAKLGDFGFARALQSSADGTSVYAKTYLGSPYYMSPEQCNGQDYNEKSDIWSLGIILYEMAQLSPPFMATNQLSLALKIKEGTFKRIPARYSEELMRVIKWMLQIEPAERPNVEDLLNLPHVSMRLRERALKRNLQHMKRKEDEVVKKEHKLNQKREEVRLLELHLQERERQVVQLEMQVAEIESSMQGCEELDDSNQFLDQNVVVRRMNSYGQNNLTTRSRLDNTTLTTSLKSSNILSSQGIRKSTNSFQPSPRDLDTYTDIMGYKNINISRDVDQSYMLKGSNTNRTTANLAIDKQSSLGSNPDTSMDQKKLKSGYYAGAKFKTGRTTSIQVAQSQTSAQIYLQKPFQRLNSLTDIQKSTSSLGSNGKPRKIKVVRTKSLNSPADLKVAPNNLRQSVESKQSLDSADVNPCLESGSFTNPLNSQLPPKQKLQKQSLKQLEQLIRKSKLVYH